MEEKKKRCCCKKTAEKTTPSQSYPGVAINEGDDGKDTRELQKERTATLNNNPRNSDE